VRSTTQESKIGYTVQFSVIDQYGRYLL